MIAKKINLSQPISAAQQFIYRHYKSLHSLRVALSFTLIFIFFRSMHDDELNYVLVTLVSIIMPVPYLGNVLARSMQRTLGTVIGSVVGIALLFTEIHSYPFMLGLALVTMFASAFIALGKHMYVGLLIGMTISIVATAPVGDMDSALIRAGQTVGGSILALVCSSIFPLKGFVFWRVKMSQVMMQTADIYDLHISQQSPPNSDDWDDKLKHTLTELLQCNTYVPSAEKETHVPASTFAAIQSRVRKSLAILELLGDTFSKSYFQHALVTENNKVLELQKNNIQIMRLVAGMIVNGTQKAQVENIRALRALTHNLHHQIDETNDASLSDNMMLGLCVELIKLLDELCHLIQIEIFKKD